MLDRLLANAQAKAKFVVLSAVVKLSRKQQVDAHVDPLFKVGPNFSMRIDPSPQATLPQHVVIAKAGRGLP